MTNAELFTKLENRETIYGFALEENRFVQELSCGVWILAHERSGGKVAIFDDHDTEKAFSLSFPAFPKDDTGVYHIIEHCIVGASEKYSDDSWPTAGPQHSFLSAFTNLESSMYPVCAYSEKSFLDLVRIYTDAVFCSAIRHTDAGLKREGWHYERDGQGKLRINGIVYNEVRAAHDMLYYNITLAKLAAAFPGSHYAFDIGGAPESVPDLTYTHFLDTYNRAFRPECCLACVCGETELEKVLAILEPYFDAEPQEEMPAAPPVIPARWTGKPLIREYSAADTAGAVIGFNWALGPEKIRTLAARMARNLLADRIAKAVLEAGLGSGAEIELETETVYPLFTVLVRGADLRDVDVIREKVCSCIGTLLKEELTAEETDAVIAATELEVREGDGIVPDGIQRALKATYSFVHDMPIIGGLLYLDAFRKIREEGWPLLRGIIRSILLENDHHTEFILVPSASLTRRRLEAEQLRLSVLEKRMSDECLQSACRVCDRETRSTKDVRTAQAIYGTTLSDLPEKLPGDRIEEREAATGKVMYFNSGEDLIRLILHFPIEDSDPESLRRLGLARLLFGRCGAEQQLQKLCIDRYTGGLEADAQRYRCREQELVYLEITAACLPQYFEPAQMLIGELISCGLTMDMTTIRATVAGWLQSCAAREPQPVERALSYHAAGCAALEYIKGLEFRRYAEHLLTQSDEALRAVVTEADALLRKICAEDRNTLGVSCSEVLWETVKDQVVLHTGPLVRIPCRTETIQGGERITNAAVTQFIAQSGSAAPVTGALAAACEAGSQILAEELRNRRGAYHARARISPEGDVTLFTGRDPHLESTLKFFGTLYRRIPELDDEVLLSAAVSAASDFYPNGRRRIGQYQKIARYRTAARYYIDGFGEEERQRLWDELRLTTADGIREAAGLLEAACEKGDSCVFAASEHENVK